MVSFEVVQSVGEMDLRSREQAEPLLVVRLHFLEHLLDVLVDVDLLRHPKEVLDADIKSHFVWISVLLLFRACRYPGQQLSQRFDFQGGQIDLQRLYVDQDLSNQ